MNYDIVTDLGREKRRILNIPAHVNVYVPQVIERSSLSCAFVQIKGYFMKGFFHNEPTTQKVAWAELCWVLTQQKKNGRALILVTTEQEEITNLLLSCPYATLCAVEKTRHTGESYLVFFWVIKQ